MNNPGVLVGGVDDQVASRADFEESAFQLQPPDLCVAATADGGSGLPFGGSPVQVPGQLTVLRVWRLRDGNGAGRVGVRQKAA
jgi:hypothetical protein